MGKISGKYWGIINLWGNSLRLTIWYCVHGQHKASLCIPWQSYTPYIKLHIAQPIARGGLWTMNHGCVSGLGCGTQQFLKR